MMQQQQFNMMANQQIMQQANPMMMQQQQPHPMIRQQGIPQAMVGQQQFPQAMFPGQVPQQVLPDFLNPSLMHSFDASNNILPYTNKCINLFKLVIEIFCNA